MTPQASSGIVTLCIAIGICEVGDAAQIVTEIIIVGRDELDVHRQNVIVRFSGAKIQQFLFSWAESVEKLSDLQLFLPVLDIDAFCRRCREATTGEVEE